MKMLIHNQDGTIIDVLAWTSTAHAKALKILEANPGFSISKTKAAPVLWGKHPEYGDGGWIAISDFSKSEQKAREGIGFETRIVRVGERP